MWAPDVAEQEDRKSVDYSSVTIPSLATPDVASPSLATPNVDMSADACSAVTISADASSADASSALTISADASSAVAGTSTSDNATDIDIFGVESVSDRNISSAKKRVLLFQKLTPEVTEKFMVFMKNTNFDLILSCVCCLKCFSNNVFIFNHHHLETTVSAYSPECKNNVL